MLKSSNGRVPMRWVRRLTFPFVGGFAAFCVAASPTLAADPGLKDNEITIDLCGPLSGPLIGYGLDPLQAAKMMYEQVDKKGGIYGRKIKLVIEDDKCTPNKLVSVVKKLTSID